MNVLKETLREKWVPVRGTPTYTLCQGCKKDHDMIIIIIPGLYYILHFLCNYSDTWLLLRLAICGLIITEENVF